MPRDQAATQPATPVVSLPGGRSAKVTETITAGRYRLEVQPDDWISRLHSAGLLDQPQVEAAERLQLLFEGAGVRSKVCSDYDPAIVDSFGTEFLLERLTPDEYRHWRRLSSLLQHVPPRARPVVAATCLWDERPTDVAHLRLGLREIARMLGISTRR